MIIINVLIKLQEINEVIENINKNKNDLHSDEKNSIIDRLHELRNTITKTLREIDEDYVEYNEVQESDIDNNLFMNIDDMEDEI